MQFITGIVVLMYLRIDVSYINQDIVYNFLLRAILTNRVTFVLLFLHFITFGGISCQSYRTKKEIWLRGGLLLLLIVGTVFLGYVLP